MAYLNAPIREAVFDIKIDQLNIHKTEDLLRFQDLVKEAFPVLKKRHNIRGEFQFSDDKPIESQAHSDHSGYVFLSQDSSRQLQIKQDGLTLNILKPYARWEEHFSAFMLFWKEYDRLFEPNEIIRIATRYINRIEIPYPFLSFQDYILNMPPIPKCLPQAFSSFFMQIQVPCKDGLRNTVITETIEPIENSILPFILDIDVFQEQIIDKSHESLIFNFTEIRNIKNDIFENCITPATRELFK